MDLVDFLERFADVELLDWQKRAIRTLDDLGKDARIHICMPRHLGRTRQMYIYMNSKELIPSGKTNDRK